MAKLYISLDVKKLSRNINIKYCEIIDIILCGGLFVFFVAITANKIIIDKKKSVNRKLVLGILKKLDDSLYIFINSLKSRVNIRCVMPNSGGPRIERNSNVKESKNRNTFLLRNNDINECTV